MARRSRKKRRDDEDEDEDDGEGFLHPETQKSIWALVFFGTSFLFILASFDKAGPAGGVLYRAFSSLFGWGYYLIPLIFLIMGVVFLTSLHRRVRRLTFVAAVLFVLAGLGLVELVSPPHGGFVGSLVSLLEIPFGSIAALIIVAIVLLASLLVVLNIPLHSLVPRLPRRSRDDEDADDDVEHAVEQAESDDDDERDDEDEEEEEEADEKQEEKEEAPRVTSFSRSMRNVFRFSRSGTRAGIYTGPPLSLLKSSVERPTSGDLRANANIIKRTLESFGITVEMGEINIGPKFTRYTLKPAEGVKLSRITALNQDLSLALAAHPIRIEAPIPGKSLVGIEVPNKAAAVVRLGSLMNYAEFQAAGELGFALGRDVNGDPMFVDIERMPHLLVAGSTGSGKSIMIHSILISLLYKNAPETLRMILIDPKRVELSLYKDIPHLLTPVVIEAKKATKVFKWLVAEMDRRYELLVEAGSRDITSYHKKKPDEPLPYLLLVIDELADLMAAYGREVEGSIVRLAQMARATGIHLILSTQRPSVEVVTGLIKANITSRIALQLPSQIDSRTILDTPGAEKLLGGGDLLYLSSELSKPRRFQGTYVSEEEVRSVVDYIKEHNQREDDEEADDEEGEGILDEGGDGTIDEFLEGDGEGDEDADDDLYHDAVAVVRQAKKASASLLQRRLKVGYARAARLLDIMEEKGVIGPGEGAKPREVYLDD